MVHITQDEFEQFVRQDTSSIRKSKQRMIRKHCSQPHRPRMQDRLMAQITQTPMTMHNLNLFPDTYIPEDREEREDGRKGGLAIDNKEGDVVDLQAVVEVSNPLAVVVGVRYDDDLVATVYKFARELVDVGFDAARLREEEVADHGDVVGLAPHGDGGSWGWFGGIRMFHDSVMVRYFCFIRIVTLYSRALWQWLLLSDFVPLDVEAWRGDATWAESSPSLSVRRHADRR